MPEARADDAVPAHFVVGSASGSLVSSCQPDPRESLGGAIEEHEPSHPSLALHIIRQLIPGQDLTRTAIPAWFLEPRSLLERFGDMLMHPDLLLDAAAKPTPEDRMMGMAAWYLSGWHYRVNGVKKPTNPVIGETFAAFVRHRDGSRTTFLAEQVSHRPPVSAMHIENPTHGIVGSGAVHTRSRFTPPQTASSVLEGGATLSLGRLGERYRFTFPTASVHGLLVGSLRMELEGRVAIACAETGCRCDVTFRSRPMMAGREAQDRLDGRVLGPDGTLVASLSGKWTGVVTATRPGEAAATLVDVAAVPVAPKYVLPVDMQGPWESRRLWGPMFEALRRRPDVDWELVGRLKHAVEEAQRRLPCHADPGKAAPWRPKLFAPATFVSPMSGEAVPSWELDRAKAGARGGEAVDAITVSATCADPRGDVTSADPRTASDEGRALAPARVVSPSGSAPQAVA